MPSLYVENIPDESYEALRKRAREHGNYIAAEVISLLADNISIATKLARRRRFSKSVILIRSRKASSSRIRSSEKLLREDRLR
jgi:plasmid stability protein